MATITMTLTTNPGGTVIQTQTTDSTGSFTFTSISNGTYTITPTISGPSAVFFPAALNVTVNNVAVTGRIFQATLGYSVSGTVSYAGATTGRVYLTMSNNNCGSGGGNGTSITAPGSGVCRAESCCDRLGCRSATSDYF